MAVNFEKNVKIFGSTGGDYIENYGRNVTITGGKGDDKISIGVSKNNLIKYASGDGNDTIYGFNSDDTLHITKGTYSTMKSGNDFIVKVGKNSILLRYALMKKSNKIAIKNSKGKVKIYNDWKKWNGSMAAGRA